MTLEEKARAINTWLRYHPDYTVTLDLFTIYACMKVEITRKGICQASDWGATLEHRLDYVLKWIAQQS